MFKKKQFIDFASFLISYFLLTYQKLSNNRHIHLLESASAETSSKRSDFPSKSPISSKALVKLKFDRTPPTVNWTVITALRLMVLMTLLAVLDSPASALIWPTELPVLRWERKDPHLRRCLVGNASVLRDTKDERLRPPSTPTSPAIKFFFHLVSIGGVGIWWR